MKSMRQFCDCYPILAFLLLAFGIAWVLWLPGLAISHGQMVTFGGFGIYAPALAGMIVSHRGQVATPSRSRARLVCFTTVFLLAGSVYVLFHKLRLDEALSPQLVVPAVLVSMIVAWIVSGAYSGDSGTREFLWTPVHPMKWRWQVIAFGCFALYLVVPAILFHLLGRPGSACQFELDRKLRNLRLQGPIPGFVRIHFLFWRRCVRGAGAGAVFCFPICKRSILRFYRASSCGCPGRCGMLLSITRAGLAPRWRVMSATGRCCCSHLPS